MTTDNLDKLSELNQKAEASGGPERARRQHEQGKLLARERLDILLDAGSFVELDRLRTHGCTDFQMQEQKFLGDAVVPVMAPSRVGWFTSIHRISRYLAVVSAVS